MLNVEAHKRKREESIQSFLEDDSSTQVMNESDEEKTSQFQQLNKKKKLADVVGNDDDENTIMMEDDNCFKLLEKIENPAERKLKEYFYSKGLKVENCIGSGGFGSVFAVQIGNHRKAIKCIANSPTKIGEYPVPVSLTIIGFQELANSIQLDDEHIIKVDDFHVIEGMVCLEMEFIEKGSLAGYKRKLTDSLIIQIVAQVCDALSYISKRNICHRDIKPGNILVKSIDFDLESIDVVVGDFGLSFSQKSIKELNHGGTQLYMDPSILEYIECIKNNPNERRTRSLPYGVETDLYSLGISIDQLAGENPSESIAKITQILKSPKKEERINFMNKMAAISQAYTKAFSNPNNPTLWHKHLEAACINSFCMELSPYQHKHFVLEVVKRNGMAIQYVSTKYKNDPEVVLMAIRQNVFSISTIYEELNQSPDLIKQNLGFIRSEIRNRFSAGENRKRDFEFYLKMARYYEETVMYVPEEMRWNRDFALKFVSVNGACLQYFKTFLNDKEIVKIALQSNPEMIEFSGFRDDLEIMKDAIEKEPELFSFASPRLRNDKELALRAVTLNPYRNFAIIHRDLKTDMEFLSNLITNSPSIIEQTAWFDPSLPFYDELASLALSFERDLYFKLPFEKRRSKPILHEFLRMELTDLIVIEAVDILSNTIVLDEEYLQNMEQRYLGQQRDSIRTLMLLIISVDRNKIPQSFLKQLFSEDQQFLYMAVKFSQDIFQIVSANVQLDNDFFLKCLENGMSVSQFPREKRADFNLMVRAISKDPNNFRYIDENLKESLEMIEVLLSTNPKLFHLIPSHLQYEKEIVKIAIKCGYRNYNNLAAQVLNDESVIELDISGLLPFVSKKFLRENPDFLLKAVKNTKEMKYLELLPFEYTDNEKIMSKIIIIDGMALEYCSHRLTCDRDFVRTAIQHNEMSLQFASPNLQVDHYFIIELGNQTEDRC